MAHKKALRKQETTLVPHKSPNLSVLLERAKSGSSPDAVTAYLDAGGSPVALSVLQGSRPPLQLPLLHYMAFRNAHPHSELAESVKLLVAAGADINAKAAGPDGNERTAFMCALERKCCTRALDVLLQASADPCARSTGCCMTALHMAAVTGSTECCELLLARADTLLELRDVNGWTALTHAAHSGHLDIIQLLVQHGADINVVSKDLTPLIAASSQKRVQVVVCLLKAGADVNAVGSNGHSALAAAVQSNSVAIVQLLLDNGADISKRDSLGHNALFRAAHQELVFMMEMEML
jgi:ankyrin repeat protein